MPRHSPAYRRFQQRLFEVRHLHRLSRTYAAVSDKAKLEKPEHVNALIRAGVVLLSSHIQGFVEDYSDQLIDKMVADAIKINVLPDRLLFYASKSTMQKIQTSTDPDNTIAAIRDFVLSRGHLLNPASSVGAELIGSEYKDGFGNPTVKEICRFLKRFGYDEFKRDMERRLKGQYLIAANAVDQIVEQRNKIAHGDPVVTSTPKDFREYLDLVQRFCSHADLLANTHFRRIGCTF